MGPLLDPSCDAAPSPPPPCSALFRVHAATQVNFQVGCAQTTGRSEQLHTETSQANQTGASEAEAPAPDTEAHAASTVESDRQQSAESATAHPSTSTQVAGATKRPVSVTSGAQQKAPQLYGKSISYCPALVMFVASLGNADDEEQGVVWLAAPKPDGTGIRLVSALKRADSTELSEAESKTSLSSESHSETKAQTQADTDRHLKTQSHSNGSSEQDEDDSDFTDEGEEDQSDESEPMDSTELPNVERTQAVSLLPISRQEMQTPGLLLGIPSHGMPGLVAYVFEPAENDGSGCAVVAQVQDMQVTQASTTKLFKAMAQATAYSPFCVLLAVLAVTLSHSLYRCLVVEEVLCHNAT